MDPHLGSMTRYGPDLVSVTSYGLPVQISMTSLGLPNLVSVTIGTGIFKKNFKKRDEKNLFQNFHLVHCDFEVFLRHIWSRCLISLGSL